MNSYLYDIHTHTSLGSTCASISLKELLNIYKKYGFSGICITEHFFKSNTTVANDLPWQKRINLFCQSYKKAREEGKKIGLEVFFGWEFTYKGTDFLTYGLDKNWLLNHPDLHKYDINDYCDLVHDCGGFIVHAHPFWLSIHVDKMIRLLPTKVDAVEINNSKRTDFENERGEEFADNYELYKVAGSDIHHKNHDQFNGIKAEKPLNNIKDLIKAIKNGNTEIVIDVDKKMKFID